MATQFSEVYSLFLGQLDDFELASVDEDELDFVLRRYLVNSLPELSSSMIDLELIDFTLNDFGAQLSYIEKAIVAKSMKLEWLREKLNSADLMVKSIGDRDFNSVQGFNYLKEISKVEKELQNDIREYILIQSYDEKHLGWVGQ